MVRKPVHGIPLCAALLASPAFADPVQIEASVWSQSTTFAEAIHDHTCECSVWLEPPRDGVADPKSATEAWSETFTLRGGTGTAGIALNGLLQTSGYTFINALGATSTATTGTGSVSASATLFFNGQAVRSLATSTSEMIQEPRLPAFEVTYGVPFTIAFSGAAAALSTLPMAADCSNPSVARCQVDSIAEADATLWINSLTIPTRSRLTWASDTEYTIERGVVAVPEPASAVLLLAGFAVVAGPVARRRKTKTPRPRD